MIKDLYNSASTISAHIALKIIEKEKITDYCDSPHDLALVCHDKKYSKTDLIEKMMSHLAEFGYFEKRGNVFTLTDQWKRTLPSKTSATKIIQENNGMALILLQEYLASHFLEIVRNDSVKISLANLIHYLDGIDSSNILHLIRDELISSVDFIGTPKNIFEMNFGLGYSTIQIASVYNESKIYSLQLNPLLEKAYEYTIKRFKKENIESSSKYPDTMLTQIQKEKVDLIFLFNPLGISNPSFSKVLNIINQIAKKDTQMVIWVPYLNQPLNTLIPEWLGDCVDGMNEYVTFENYKIVLAKNNFQINAKKSSTISINAYFSLFE